MSPQHEQISLAITQAKRKLAFLRRTTIARSRHLHVKAKPTLRNGHGKQRPGTCFHQPSCNVPSKVERSAVAYGVLHAVPTAACHNKRSAARTACMVPRTARGSSGTRRRKGRAFCCPWGSPCIGARHCSRTASSWSLMKEMHVHRNDRAETCRSRSIPVTPCPKPEKHLATRYASACHSRQACTQRTKQQLLPSVSCQHS